MSRRGRGMDCYGIDVFVRNVKSGNRSQTLYINTQRAMLRPTPEQGSGSTGTPTEY